MPFERAMGKAWRTSRPVLGRCWTTAWLLLPLPWLFHRPFLAGLVWPLLSP
jgi:hypothetical protein